jgi:hypothetical protein
VRARGGDGGADAAGGSTPPSPEILEWKRGGRRNLAFGGCRQTGVGSAGGAEACPRHSPPAPRQPTRTTRARCVSRPPISGRMSYALHAREAAHTRAPPQGAEGRRRRHPVRCQICSPAATGRRTLTTFGTRGQQGRRARARPARGRLKLRTTGHTAVCAKAHMRRRGEPPSHGAPLQSGASAPACERTLCSVPCGAARPRCDRACRAMNRA